MMSTKPAGLPSSNSTPKLSVIIPVYNGAVFVNEAIESVIAQKYPDTEIIVVDDGSTDTTPKMLEAMGDRITVLTQSHKGPSAARNLGIQHAHGSVIGLLDADDVWPLGRIHALLPYLQTGELYVCGTTEYIRHKGEANEERSAPRVEHVLVGSCLYDASLFERVGLFDESMTHGEDLDWYFRSRECGVVQKCVPVPALLYRRHEGNLTNARDAVNKGKEEALQKKILRAKERLV